MIAREIINALDVVERIERFSVLRDEALDHFHQDIAHPLLTDLLVLHPHYIELVHAIGTHQVSTALQYFLKLRASFDPVRVSTKKMGKHLSNAPIHPLAKLYLKCALDCVPIGEVPKDRLKHLAAFPPREFFPKDYRRVKKILKVINYWDTGKLPARLREKFTAPNEHDIYNIGALIIGDRSAALCRLCEIYETSRRAGLWKGRSNSVLGE